jgi:hypothetical protein
MTAKRSVKSLSAKGSGLQGQEGFLAKNLLKLCAVCDMLTIVFGIRMPPSRTLLSVADIGYRGPFPMAEGEHMAKILEGDLEFFPESR